MSTAVLRRSAGPRDLVTAYLDDIGAPDQPLVDAALRASVGEALAALRPREAYVIRQYFGFDVADPLTLEAIGIDMGITRERARQIKERALRKLGKSSHRDALAAFHE